MPIYSTLCAACGERSTVFRRVAERDQLPECGCGGALRRVLDKPYVQPDIAPYESPITPGVMINSRTQRKEEMVRHGKMDWEPGLKQDILRNQQRNIDAACAVADKGVDQTVASLVASGHLET